MRVECEFVGKTDLLMHADAIEARDDIADWGALSIEQRKATLKEAVDDIAGKKVKGGGDDRLPPWRWQYCLHHDGDRVVIPAEYISSAFKNTAKLFKNGTSTLMRESQTGLYPDKSSFPLLIKGKPVDMHKIDAMKMLSFKKQTEAVKALGFELFVASAVNKANGARHIRVRPRFSDWSCKASFTVLDPITWTAEKLAELLGLVGSKSGFGDWRPSNKTPGPFGVFHVKYKIVD